MELTLKMVVTSGEKEQVMAIRREVFIKEQKVPEKLEIDEYEDRSTSILALWGISPIGTARWRKTDSGIKLERFAVLRPYRNQNVGRSLLEFILQQVPLENNIYLFAQEQVIGFYEKNKFKVSGKRFYEAGIPHFKMTLKSGK
ncbi:MAG: GNAT family N-acetyltransferase [Candidatus Neomarinimicrobiota bacterium]